MAKTTKAQRRTIYRKFCQNADGARTYREFRRRVRGDFWGTVVLPWCGMYVQIESDGYAHT